jgi:hypothetical protein
MAISDTSLSVDVFGSIRTALVSASIAVTSQTVPTEVTSASILAAYNDKSVGRPQIIINPIQIDESGYKFGGVYGKKFINITVDCYYKNSLGIDQMYDQVYNALAANTVEGISLVGVTTDVEFDSPGEQKYHRKSGTFTYTRE